MGDEDLGFDIKMGVEDLSIVKIKNHHNRLNQEGSAPDSVVVPEPAVVSTEDVPILGVNYKVANSTALSQVSEKSKNDKTKSIALVESKDQDSEIARLQHKLDEDKSKLANA